MAIDQVLKRKVNFLAAKTCFCLVDRAKLVGLPESLRSYTASANRELLQAVGITLAGLRDRVFVFTTEDRFIRGSRELKKNEQTIENRKVTSIGVSPRKLVQEAVYVSADKLVIDYGTADKIEMERGDVESMLAISSIVEMLTQETVYVLQDKDRFAITLSLNEKQYVVAFMEYPEAVRSSKGIGEGVKAEPNPAFRALREVLQSRYHGLVLNPGLDAQQILDKEALRLVPTVSGCLSGGFFRRLIRAITR